MARPALLLLLAATAAAHSYRPTTYALQCRVDDPLSCAQEKHEVCVFTNGRYRCECPNGVSRLSDGRCLLVNECSRPSTNGCHKDADCIDQTVDYTCRCRAGFADVSQDRQNKPGRICQRTANECSAKSTYGVDCDPNAACVDTPEGFQCACQPGFVDISATVSKLPGRKCVEVKNECADNTDDCSDNADCFDRPDGYECRCKPGYVDASPDVGHYPGRVCNRPKGPEHYGVPQQRQPQCSGAEQCGPNEECRYNAKGELTCQCRRGAVQQADGKCKVFSQCEQANECDKNAICSNTFDGYKCQCKAGFRDISPDPFRFAGRKCQQLTNECADGTADCSPFALCEDTQDSFLCKCKPGYTDVSSRYNLQPGRKCSEGAHQCSDPSLNSCDKNADCVQLPDGYTCKCFAGYVDVSTNANLPPGRVCTLSTACPAQKTDLVFLIDGSGSIGSYIFQTEVLRFLSEFTELFDIAPEKTRVSVVQYSDQIRHEFGLSDYKDSRTLHEAIRAINYLTGLTRTGAAIEHVATQAFSEARGARPISDGVSRVCIVITDGRSQDNVTIPANNARLQDIQLFAVGVTNHVLDSELEEISGSKDRTFHVNGFEDLNTRLRSAIQRVACPQTEGPQTPAAGPCDANNNSGCDRALNQVCTLVNGRPTCSCPKGFELHPVTKACGGDACNPEISTSCPDPEICEKTPYGNWRCTCPEDLGWRDAATGVCKIGEKPQISASEDECHPGQPGSCPANSFCVKGPGGEFICQCKEGLERNGHSGKCQAPGTCDPSVAGSCDARKHERCLPDANGLFTCQCGRGQKRHPVTDVCLTDECTMGKHDCHVNAVCVDTDESFICMCRDGFLDKSPNPKSKPGRVCEQQRNECADGSHNCSPDAECIDLPDGFLCRCKNDFVDVSPNTHVTPGLQCKALVDECARRETNTCHEHALCIDTRDSYKCQCKEGYVDHDELRNPGRDCRKQNQLCEGGKHDCDVNAKCVERGANDYECVCKAGFLDASPLPHRPGRKCLERICLDSTRHDCHAAATCKEVDGAEKYTCQCRDGYVDKMPARPGRMCLEQVNECLDASLNDCDPAAICKDLDDRYTCQCPAGTKDISPSVASKPGRNCFGLVDECHIPALNNCSHFADCFDKENGYDCKCKPEYFDQEPSNPGRKCKFIINECLAEHLNDCDRNALCKDTLEGYECECKAPFKDESPEQPGRVCRYNECLNAKDNDCDKNAECIDTDDAYLCQCKSGFFDESQDPSKTGRVCIEIDRKPQQAEATTLSPNLLPCGTTHCRIDLHEHCIGGEKCGCRPGENRASPTEQCIPVVEIPLPLIVTDIDEEPVHFSTDFSKPGGFGHIQVVESAKKGLGDILKQTDIGPRVVTTDVNYITNPKVANPNWDHGLLVNNTISLSGQEDVDQCKVFRDFATAVESRGNRVDRLKLSDDFKSLDPCKPKAVAMTGIACGASFCNPDLGEECIAGKVCGCPKGQKRRNATSPCRAVEEWNLPLYVIRDGPKTIEYSPDFGNPLHELTKQMVSRFESGVGESYDHTPLKKAFVTAEVNDIEKPSNRKPNWKDGVLYNFTASFVRGTVAEPSTVFSELYDYMVKKNNFEVGTSKLFISPDQLNPFSACYNSDCHPTAICKESGGGHGGYTCQCADGYRDLNPARPGRKCLAFRGVNECEDPSLNECSPNARCIDMEYLYKCECVSPYVNAASEGAVPGSVCSIDYCSDVNYCPLNSTCHNVNEEAKCDCRPGFVDLRKSERLSEAGLGDTICLRSTDVNECALGLHNCSAAAICTDKKNGYDCKCPEGYSDGNPSEPGRICAALLCGLCNGHGDCIHDALSNNVTCSCVDGYTGQFCEVAPSKLPLLLMLLLALLFALLALLCCLYLCARCRCFGARGVSQGSASGDQLFGSDYYTIPRAKLKGYGDDMGQVNEGALAAYLDDGASVSSDGSLEEIERRVTTDVTTREIRTTTVRDEHGNVISQSQSVHHGGAAGGGMGGMAALETEVDQFAMTSSDHFRHAAARAESRASQGSYDSDSEASDDGGHAVFDRRTRATESHDFQPGPDPRTGVERRKNEFVTTTTAEEVNYF